MRTNPLTTRWHFTATPVLLTVWDDDGVLYQTSSNETHYLSPLGLWVVNRCTAAPEGITGGELFDHLNAALDPSTAALLDTQRLEKPLHDLLIRLHTLGLLWASDC